MGTFKSHKEMCQFFYWLHHENKFPRPLVTNGEVKRNLMQFRDLHPKMCDGCQGTGKDSQIGNVHDICQQCEGTGIAKGEIYG